MASETLRRPRGFFKRGGYWYYTARFGGRERRLSTGQTTLEEAKAWVVMRPAPEAELVGSRYRPPAPPNPFYDVPFEFSNEWVASTVRKGLTEGDVKKLIARAAGRCEVTGLPFTGTDVNGAIRRPFIPSIDRIDCHQPYSMQNCRLVCFCVNVALNQWGDAVFDLVCLARCTMRLAVIGRTKSSYALKAECNSLMEQA